MPSEVLLGATLTLPKHAQALVMFAHGSGSSRFSPRNRFVAKALNAHGLGTLLLDLLTPEEEAVDEGTRQFRFDISLLAERLVQATEWLSQQPSTQQLKVAYFGSSTGAAAALIAAARLGNRISAVVSRGGRPDLAGVALPQVVAPTLLLVGGNDTQVIGLNQNAYDQMMCERELMIIPRATHLFEEPGTLEQVAEAASEWFVKYCHVE
jgi:dienelactone hydrolase